MIDFEELEIGELITTFVGDEGVVKEKRPRNDGTIGYIVKHENNSFSDYEYERNELLRGHELFIHERQ